MRKKPDGAANSGGDSSKNTLKLRFKHFFSYILCIGMMICFCLVLNGRLGLYFAVMLALALLLSFVLTCYAAKQTEITFVSRSEMINKGDTVEISFAVSKRSWLPTPFIEISLDAAGNLQPATPERFRIALGFSRKKRSYSVRYRARYCGSGNIGIKPPVIIDYLGLFETRVNRLTVSGDGVCRFGIIPSIHEISGSNELLRICCDASSYDDDSEETDESAPIGTGTAGYEHREYTAGDPIKRINWKLSSKRDMLMIRLDEKTASAKQIMIFELSDERLGDENYFKCTDILIEASLAMARLMLRQGLGCTVFCRSDGWQRFEIDGEETLSEYQASLALCKPVGDGSGATAESAEAIDELDGGRNKVVMYFTNRKDTLVRRVGALAEKGCDVYTVLADEYADAAMRAGLNKCYSVGENFVFTSVI